MNWLWAFAVVASFVAGMFCGKWFEQKATSLLLKQFATIDNDAHIAVNRLCTRLPFLKKYLD